MHCRDMQATTHYTLHTLTWSPEAAPLQWLRLSASDSSDSFETSAGEKSNTVTSAKRHAVRPSICLSLPHSPESP